MSKEPANEKTDPADDGRDEKERFRFRPYHHPAAGWGAAKSVTRFLAREGEFLNGPRATMRMNHEGGGLPISWADAFELVGRTLRELDDPNRAAYYTSGRLGNEATFLYQLLARAGHEQPSRLLEIDDCLRGSQRFGL